MSMKISELTRRDIADAIIIERINWAGRLHEPDFLGRIFNLSEMPSNDSRFKDAYGDIWQHRINNYDWDDDWVFCDDRFNLLTGEDEVFLRFLCEMLHPVVRRDPAEVEQLKEVFNHALRRDGIELFEALEISGRPVFESREVSVSGADAFGNLLATIQTVNADYVRQQIKRMESAISDDPALAIGTAKELVETCCKTILTERNVEIPNNANLPRLVRLANRELKLTPDDIPEEAKAVDMIQRLLRNLATIADGIAELRNSYGTGHGHEANTRGLQPRHAKLAVGAASTLAVFLIETHQLRPNESRDSSEQ